MRPCRRRVPWMGSCHWSPRPNRGPGIGRGQSDSSMLSLVNTCWWNADWWPTCLLFISSHWPFFLLILCMILLYRDMRVKVLSKCQVLFGHCPVKHIVQQGFWVHKKFAGGRRHCECDLKTVKRLLLSCGQTRTLIDVKLVPMDGQ